MPDEGARLGGDLVVQPGVPGGPLRTLLERAGLGLYPAIGFPNAATACVFTSAVLADALVALGIEARPVPVAVEGQGAGFRFGIGHPDHGLSRPGAWKGHVCCMAGDILIDPTIGTARRAVPEGPLMAVLRAAEPWRPDARLDLPGCRLTWQAEGAAADWQSRPDLHLPQRAEAAARVAAAFRAALPGPG